MNRIVDVVIPPLAQPLSYGLPHEAQIEIGFRVAVPLGSRLTSGFVISKSSEKNPNPELKLKLITLGKGNYQAFAPAQLRFFRWVADYYRVPLANVIEVAVPPAASARYTRMVHLSEAKSELIKGKTQRAILNLLAENGGALDYSLLQSRFRQLATPLKRLVELGVVRIDQTEAKDHHRLTAPPPSWAKKTVELNEHQLAAVKAIGQALEAKKFGAFLLHGVTGSGKTEVYLELINQARASGKGALLIVPEIALTPQLIDRFRARLGSEVSVLHSALSRRARWDAWRALLEDRVRVAIGARSAVFAPVPNLGLIIVDEEHDSSYKQSDGLRYHARDLAVVRGQLDSCPVVLGSATPSLETYANALKERYLKLDLPTRPGRTSTPLSYEIVDLNKQKPWDMPSKNISVPLHQALTETLARQEQTFILYNRRGFASYLQCAECEAVIECPNCSVTLTYHQKTNSLQCHYCNLSRVPPTICPNCQGLKKAPGQTPALAPAEGTLVQRGAGTERVFEEIQSLFPEAKLDRLDRDAVSDATAYRAILDRVRTGATQILVGTQMIAKGHDLPGVTLVGLVDCDVGLHMPDFRAGERVFQLLTQASGRAGRGLSPGRVILQTRVPRHASLVYTAQHDFSGFAQRELEARKKWNYPPFCRLLRIVASAQDKDRPARLLRAFREYLLQQLTPKGLELLGPAPAPLAKIKNEWRYHLIVKSAKPSMLNQIIGELQARFKRERQLKVIFDLDPQEML